MNVCTPSVTALVLAVVLSAPAQAETIRLLAVADGFVADGLGGAKLNGKPDGIAENFGTRVSFLLGQGDQRAVIHFDVNSLKGQRVQKATLRLDIVHKETTQSAVFPIEVRGYNSLGQIRLGDFFRGGFIKVFDGVAARFDRPVSIDVTASVKSGMSSPAGMIGFTLRSNANGTVTFGSIEDGAVVTPRLIVVTE